MYVCLCRGITDQDIKDAIANGAESYRDVRDALDLGTWPPKSNKDNDNTNDLRSFFLPRL